ncbi:hypothetical protein NDU88_002339 [Pleurodeles waltl]|uniref:Uncharacterized protein n=1 Tax=Pleurodeles waltl TaxID=8319 RepID=A0AAV7R9Z0_PLEWA|nr:hypothetical protein NDU88_002339 [Pleurodeles waltl]
MQFSLRGSPVSDTRHAVSKQRACFCLRTFSTQYPSKENNSCLFSLRTFGTRYPGNENNSCLFIPSHAFELSKAETCCRVPAISF